MNGHRRVPDAFLVGAARSGTTSLAGLLAQHPSIAIPNKEPSFFSDYGNPMFPDLGSYLALYADCPAEVVVVDASTSHLPSVHAARKIHALNPEARIAMILRNPVDRAYSLYWFKVRSLSEPLTFEAALEAEPGRIREGRTFGCHYETTGLYAEHVQRYLDVFGKDRVRIHLFDDYARDPLPVARDLFGFFGVDRNQPLRIGSLQNRSGPPRSRAFGRFLSGPFPGRRLIKRILPAAALRLKRPLREINSRRPPPMDPATRARLVERFRPDVERLQGLLGRDLSHWTMNDSARRASGVP